VTHLFFFLFNSIRRKNYVLPVATSPKKPIPNFWTFKNIGGFFVCFENVSEQLFVCLLSRTHGAGHPHIGLCPKFLVVNVIL